MEPSCRIEQVPFPPSQRDRRTPATRLNSCPLNQFVGHGSSKLKNKNPRFSITMNTTNITSDLPVSQRIRNRLQQAGLRFHANDNIADHIEDGELEQLQAEIQEKLRVVLDSLVIDIEHDHNSMETAKRVAKMFITEVFRGRYVKMPTSTEFPNVEKLNELMIIGPITVRSACSHHLCPIIGGIWVGVMPNEHSNLIGLSKYARLIDWVMSRPQIQEEAVSQIADLLMKKLQPDGLAIVMEADHFCMHWRGVKESNTKMTNSVMRGSFLSDANLRREFLSLMHK